MPVWLWFLLLGQAIACCMSCGSPQWPCRSAVDASYVLAGMLVDERTLYAGDPDWVAFYNPRRQLQLTLRVEDVVRQPGASVSVGDQVIVVVNPSIRSIPVGPHGRFGDAGDTVLFFADPHPDKGRGGRAVVRHRDALVRAKAEADPRCEAVARLARGVRPQCGPGQEVLGRLGLPPGKSPGEVDDLLGTGVLPSDPSACDGMSWPSVLTALESEP